MKLTRIDVTYRYGQGWAVAQPGRIALQSHLRTQKDAFAFARNYGKLHPDGITVRIHRKNGRIREERAFPRNRDPWKSRG